MQRCSQSLELSRIRNLELTDFRKFDLSLLKNLLLLISQGVWCHRVHALYARPVIMNGYDFRGTSYERPEVVEYQF
jgi:hypothetical protein